MPVDFHNEKYYEFDFDKLTTMPKEVYESDRFNKYLNDWNTLLHKLDNISRQEYNFWINTFNSKSYYPEYYQFTQKYINGCNPYVFNFHIEYILSNIQRLGLKKRHIGVKKLSKIASLDKTITLDGGTVKSDPIVICPFILPNAKFVILDGNTRMNYYLENNKLFTRHIIYNITSKNDFLFSVDWAMYSFVNEINAFIQDYRNKDKMESNVISSKIYLSTFISEANRNYTF